MTHKIAMTNTVRTPMTKQDIQAIALLCEHLITEVQGKTSKWDSVFAKQTAEDLMDVIIDLKTDLCCWGKKEAVLMHDDGFCDPITIGEK